MTEDIAPDGMPSGEGMKAIGSLTAADFEKIDDALLAESSAVWRKSARVVGFAMSRVRFNGIPDVFYAQRLKGLVERGKLEAVGDLNFMRYSEVRLRSGCSQKVLINCTLSVVLP